MAVDTTELAVRLESTHSLCVANEKRIGDLESDMKSLHDTQISLVKIANSVENMGQSIIELNKKVDGIGEKQDEFTAKVSALENQPAQKTKKIVDDIVEKVAWLIVGGVVVWFLGKLFPSITW